MCTSTQHDELSLAATPASAGRARAFVRASGCRDHRGHLDDAVLLVSELVTNAVRHGVPPITVATTCGHGTWRVCVSDGSPVLPQQRAPSLDGESGRGMALVDGLSSAWGVDRVATARGGGKAVWFELRTA